MLNKALSVLVNKAEKDDKSVFFVIYSEKLEKYNLFSSTTLEKLGKSFAEHVVSVSIFHF